MSNFLDRVLETFTTTGTGTVSLGGAATGFRGFVAALGGGGTVFYFMIGAPGETIETVRETLAFCEEHVSKTDMVLFSTGIRVYAGTPLERTCKDMGWFAEDDPLFFPSWFLSPALELGELYSMLVRAADEGLFCHDRVLRCQVAGGSLGLSTWA